MTTVGGNRNGVLTGRDNKVDGGDAGTGQIAVGEETGEGEKCHDNGTGKETTREYSAPQQSNGCWKAEMSNTKLIADGTVSLYF